MTALRLKDLPAIAMTVARTYGFRGFALRATHEIRRKGNAFRAGPAISRAGDGQPLSWLMVDAKALRSATNHRISRERAVRVEQGEYEAFRRTWRMLPFDCAGWHCVRGDHTPFPRDARWWRIPLMSAVHGDIKEVWEPARFSWTYDLIRSYRAEGREESAEAFFRILENWAKANHPFLGVHWSCGQEVAIRAIALLHAEANFADSTAATPERRALLAQVLAWSGERISNGIGYAISQRNNHALSEAVGLALLGQRFHGVMDPAKRWALRGRALFNRLVEEQFEADGWYAQHSFTYLRLALDHITVMCRLLSAIGESWPPIVGARIDAAFHLLASVTDPAGDVPNHGANDGAFVYPITLAAYRDFRPVLTAIAALRSLPLPQHVSADSEVLAWIGRPAPESGRPLRALESGDSGWVAARHKRALLFVRAGAYRSRPSHSDGLHVDIRLDGRPFVSDAGTYTYNGAPWTKAFSSASVHNGPLVDGHEPGVRGPRFLWYRWPNARISRLNQSRHGVDIVASRPDVERSIQLRDNGVLIIDRPTAAGRHRVDSNWLLAPGISPAQIECDAERRVHEPIEGNATGWISWAYGCKERGVALALRRESSSDDPMRVFIRFEDLASHDGAAR